MFQGWLDTRTLPFPGEPDRTCDTVAEMLDAAHLGRLWALIVEFQSEPDAEILDRLLEYMVRLRREVRHGPDHRTQYWTAACLLNLTGPAQINEIDMALPCTMKCVCDSGRECGRCVTTTRPPRSATSKRKNSAAVFCRGFR